MVLCPCCPIGTGIPVDPSTVCDFKLFQKKHFCGIACVIVRSKLLTPLLRQRYCNDTSTRCDATTRMLCLHHHLTRNRRVRAGLRGEAHFADQLQQVGRVRPPRAGELPPRAVYEPTQPSTSAAIAQVSRARQLLRDRLLRRVARRGAAEHSGGRPRPRGAYEKLHSRRQARSPVGRRRVGRILRKAREVQLRDIHIVPRAARNIPRVARRVPPRTRAVVAA